MNWRRIGQWIWCRVFGRHTWHWTRLRKRRGVYRACVICKKVLG